MVKSTQAKSDQKQIDEALAERPRISDFSGLRERVERIEKVRVAAETENQTLKQKIKELTEINRQTAAANAKPSTKRVSNSKTQTKAASGSVSDASMSQ